MQRVVYQHPQKCSYSDPRLDSLAKCAFLLPAAYVVTDKVINSLDKIAEKSRGKFVFLERRVKYQPHETNVGLVLFKGAESEIVENLEIVAFCHRLLQGDI